MHLDCLHEVLDFTDKHVVQKVKAHTRSVVQRVPLTLAKPACAAIHRPMHQNFEKNTDLYLTPLPHSICTPLWAVMRVAWPSPFA